MTSLELLLLKRKRKTLKKIVLIFQLLNLINISKLELSKKKSFQKFLNENLNEMTAEVIECHLSSNLNELMAETFVKH
jgi:hypothetical protein